MHVVSVLFPEPRDIVVQELQPTQPFDRLPGVEMGHNQTQRVTVVRRKRLTVMMSGQQDIVTIQISKRDISGEALLSVYQNMRRFSLRIDSTKHFPKRHALPLIVKAAPTRDAVKIAGITKLG